MTPYYADDLVTLYHGDCREVIDGIRGVDHAITDPPYGVDVYLRMRNQDSTGGNRRHAIKGKDSLISMKAGAIGELADLVDPVSRALAMCVRRWCIVFADAESVHEWRLALLEHGMRHARVGAWIKPDAMPQMTGDRPGVGFEPCEIAHSTHVKMAWNGGGKPAVWTHNIVKGAARPEHPCPKPEPLMMEIVSQFTDPGETILDPFAGSGTTLVASKRLGRKAIGIELQESYCEVIARRCSQGSLAEMFAPEPSFTLPSKEQEAFMGCGLGGPPEGT